MMFKPKPILMKGQTLAEQAGGAMKKASEAKALASADLVGPRKTPLAGPRKRKATSSNLLTQRGPAPGGGNPVGGSKLLGG